jgi:hypothetical protein
MYITEILWQGVDWINLTQNRDKWWALFNTVMHFLGSIKCSRFVDQLKN